MALTAVSHAYVGRAAQRHRGTAPSATRLLPAPAAPGHACRSVPLLQRARRGGAAVCGAADEKGGVSPADAAPPAVRRTNEEPPWVRRERERELQAAAPKELPFGVYLLLSVIVAIAATGSIFEFGAQNPIFGVLGADSPLYTPILGLFVLTGFPMSGYLFSKCISAANAESERADKLDGL